MSDPAKEPDIEDVLASVRRLVTAERRERPRAASALVLTPSQRVERAAAPDAEEMRRRRREDQEDLAADSARALADASWEEDEPQDAFSSWMGEAPSAGTASRRMAGIGRPANDPGPAQDIEDGDGEIEAWDVEPPEALGMEDAPAPEAAAEPAIQEEDAEETRQVEEILDAAFAEIVEIEDPDDPEPEDAAGAEMPEAEAAEPAAEDWQQDEIEAELEEIGEDVGEEEASAQEAPEPRVAFQHDPAPEIPAAATGGAGRPLFEAVAEASAAGTAERTRFSDASYVDGPSRSEIEAAARAEAEALRAEGYVDFDEVEIEATTEIDPDAVEDAELIGEEPPEADLIDEEALREMVSDIVREELRGRLGERITSNVRKLVRREIHRILAARDFE